MFLKNKNIILKIRRSKVTDYAALKEAWGCTQPFVEYIAIMFNQQMIKFGNAAAGKGYDHVSSGLKYPRGGQSEMDRDPEGQSRVMTLLA